MDDRATWSNTWRYVLGIALCLLLGWVALIRGARIPVLSLVDLGFHELGHFVTYMFPDLVTAAMGSVLQVAVPVGLAFYFALRVHDRLGAGLCLAWAGTSAQQVSVYVADAPFQRLPLLGGEHDWAFILNRLDALDHADGLASIVMGMAILLVIAGIAMCGWALWHPAVEHETYFGRPETVT